MSDERGDQKQHVVWERQQPELWDRIFQVTQDVVTLAESLEDSIGQNVVRTELVKSAMGVGAQLVRANAATEAADFQRHVGEARMLAIEADYWLRLIYVLQQREEVQQDLSNVITQYASIITLLQKFMRHTKGEVNVIAKHANKGPRVVS